MARDVLALRLLHGLNALAVLFWVLFAIEALSPVRIPAADYGVPLGMLVLFVAIPAGLLAQLILGRRSSQRGTNDSQWYRYASVVFLGITWLPTWSPVVFLLAVFQPWPLSLREGPDTDFAREGFERLYGAQPPDSVSGVHYRIEGPRDPIFYLRFTTCDDAVVERLAERLRLDRTTATPGLPAGGPPWFDAPGGAVPDGYWLRREGWEALWYFRDSGLALYRDVTF